MNHIQIKKSATDKMAVGIKNLTEVVGSTLGPDGKIVFFERPNNLPPVASKDGVTVATLTSFEDPHENMGANIVKFAAAKTAQDAGDGTTSSTILANYMIQEGIKALNKGVNSRHLADGIVKAAKAVSAYLLENAVTIKTDDDMIKNVALVSSNYDEDVAGMIADVIKKIGIDGVINIIQSMGTKTSMEYVEGLHLKSYMLHPSFITNHERGSCEYKNVAVIITDYEVSQFDELNAAFGPIWAHGEIQRQADPNTQGEIIQHQKVEAFLFIQKALLGEAMQSLVKSREVKGAPFVAVKAPWGDNLTEVLSDVAAVTGGHCVSEQAGFSLKEGNSNYYAGWCERITINSQGLTIIGGGGSQEAVNGRLTYLRKKLTDNDHPTTKAQIEQRIARLKNGIAQITVGGDNESVMKEKAYRVEDAKFAVKAALEEGVTVGGGISYLKALKNISGLKGVNSHEQKGIDIVKGALLSPIYKILENSGYNKIQSDVIVSEILNETLLINKIKKFITRSNFNIPNVGENLGFNARTKKFEDLFFAGVIDPVKVDRSAIENAASVTSQFLNTGAIIAILDDNRNSQTSSAQI